MHFTMFCNGALGPAVVVILLHAKELLETWVPYSPEQKGNSNIVVVVVPPRGIKKADLRVGYVRADDCWSYMGMLG